MRLSKEIDAMEKEARHLPHKTFRHRDNVPRTYAQGIEPAFKILAIRFLLILSLTPGSWWLKVSSSVARRSLWKQINIPLQQLSNHRQHLSTTLSNMKFVSSLHLYNDSDCDNRGCDCGNWLVMTKLSKISYSKLLVISRSMAFERLPGEILEHIL